MDANIIIVGGGCAGMQLVNAFLKLPLDQTGNILLIESKREIVHKSWCFWSDDKTEYDFLIDKHWSELRFGSVNTNLTKPITPYRYNYINSETFFNYHYDLISKDPRVTVVYDEVEMFKSEEGIKKVFTRNKHYEANYVYSSIPDIAKISTKKILLWQHFKGWFIKTEKAVFNINQATMMDFNIPQGDASHFMYVLPFSETEALIEFTSFSSIDSYTNEKYDTYLEKYIVKTLDCPYQITKEEKGKIPMTDFEFSATSEEGIIHIGTTAGSIKPSTGYAFNRITRHTQHLINCFLKNNEGIDYKYNPSRFTFYDTLLLQIIKEQPEKVSMIMYKLFSRNSFNKILNFLDEKTTLLQEINIFKTLPKALFLKEVLKYVRHKY